MRSVAQQRIRRIPTKIRADAVRPEPESPAAGRWWQRSGGRHAQAGRTTGYRPTGGRDRRSWLRWGVIGAVIVVVGVLAVQAGLIWAGTDGRQGTVPPLSGAAEKAGLSPATGRAGPGSAPSAIAPSATARAPDPARAPDSSRPTRPPTLTAGPTPTRSRPGTTASATARAVAANPGTTASAIAQWLDVVRRLDRARAAALVRRDAARLDAVYTPTAAAKTADGSTIARLTAQGLRVDGAAHRIIAVRVIRRGPAITVEVTDSLPSYQVRDARGEPAGSTEARGTGRRLLDLVRTASGYRIAGVRTA